MICPNCEQEHGEPRCWRLRPPHCTGSYTAEYAVTPSSIRERPPVAAEPKRVWLPNHLDYWS